MDLATLVINVQYASVNAATASLNALSKASGRAEGSVAGLGAVSSKLGSAFAALAGAALGGQLIKTIAQLDSLQRSFRVITGSVVASEKEMRFMMDTANKLGVEFTTAAEAYAGLSAAAKGTTLEGQGARDIFMSVSNAMTVLGRSADQTRGALLSIQQMISKGQVQAEELRGQLGERLPGAFQAAARAMGVSTQRLSKMLELGLVKAEELLPKLVVELNKMYGSGTRAETLGAAMNRLENAFTSLFMEIGRVSSDSLRILIDQMAEFVKQSGQAVNIVRALGRVYAEWQAEALFKAKAGQISRGVATQEEGVSPLGGMNLQNSIKEIDQFINAMNAAEQIIRIMWENFGVIVTAAFEHAVTDALKLIQTLVNGIIKGVNWVITNLNALDQYMGLKGDFKTWDPIKLVDPAAETDAQKQAKDLGAIMRGIIQTEMAKPGILDQFINQVQVETQELATLQKRMQVRGGGPFRAVDPLANPPAAVVTTGTGGTKKLNEWQREIDQLQDQTDALKQQAHVYGMAEDAAAKYTATKRLEYAAKEANLKITPAMRLEIEREAAAYAAATRELMYAKEAVERLDQARSLATGSLSSLKEDLMAGTGVVQSFVNALDRLGDKLFELAENQFWEIMLGKSGTTNQGILGSFIASMIGGSTPAGYQTSVINSVGPKAAGGMIRGPGSGTSDSIHARVSNGEYIVNAGATRRNLGLLQAINSGRRFARGGLVGMNDNRSGPNVEVHLHGMPAGMELENGKTRKTTAPNGDIRVDAFIRTIVREEVMGDFEERGQMFRRLERVSNVRRGGQ